MKKGDTKRKTWRKVRKGGVPALKSPDGVYYYGRREEVRDAHLTPEDRRRLASSLRLVRMWRAGFDDVHAQEAAAELRRDAIFRGCVSKTQDSAACDLRIMIEAAARYMGQTPEEFERDAMLSAIEGTIDLALSDGLPELPLTRYERRAFQGRQSDYSLTIAMQERKAAKGGEVRS